MIHVHPPTRKLNSVFGEFSCVVVVVTVVVGILVAVVQSKFLNESLSQAKDGMKGILSRQKAFYIFVCGVLMLL